MQLALALIREVSICISSSSIDVSRIERLESIFKKETYIVDDDLLRRSSDNSDSPSCLLFPACRMVLVRPLNQE